MTTKVKAMTEVRQNSLKWMDDTKTELRVRNMEIERHQNTIFSQESEKRMIQKATDNALSLIDT